MLTCFCTSGNKIFICLYNENTFHVSHHGELVLAEYKWIRRFLRIHSLGKTQSFSKYWCKYDMVSFRKFYGSTEE